MKNLPISINITAAQPVSSNTSTTATQSASNKPASSDDNNSTQGTKSFGDELARQVHDSSPADKPAETATKESASASTSTGKGEKESATSSEATVVVPADILATLLAAQQTQAGLVPQDAAQLQQIVSSQIAAALPDTALTTAAGTAAKLTDMVKNVATLQSGQAGRVQADDKTLAKPELPASTTAAPAAADAAHNKPDASGVLKVADKNADAQPAMPVASKDKPNFTDAINTAGKNELASGLAGESLRNRKSADLSSAVQQPVAPTIAAASAQVQAPAALAAIPASQLTVNTPVNQPGWGNEFNQKITWLSTQRNQSAELHLNPPQLGPLDVVLKVSGDQAVALFTSPHAAVRDAIEQALPKLRDMLADNGIMLGNATVSDQSTRKDQEDLSRSQQGTRSVSGLETEATAVHTLGGRVSAISRHNGMVDTFA